MSRYTGPTTKLNRRFGQNILPTCKSEERRPYPPGVHGPTLRRKVTGYSIGLNEKQKLRFMYGLSEKQFRLTFARAKEQGGVVGENFLTLLENRLDSVVYNLGFANTRRGARQLVCHGHICVNGHKVDISSYSCAIGDKISVRERTSSKGLVTKVLEAQNRAVPAWLTCDKATLSGTVDRKPAKEEMVGDINVQLIVEFYSR
ncbi:MAG: 30S ribosomal protein S4 [Opitutales bacterium]|nr:30S ribosomal protein S4 [Opitutales bacterium]